MLTLLKQARAFGLGICLATQNPVDLDYKGLSNMGTWFLGRLQTQRDKERVLEGLEGAAAQSGSKFDRGKMEETLAALGSRVFLMNNVHDDGPTVFQSRWALSFLRGPLSRSHIQSLMDSKRSAAQSGSSKAAGASSHAGTAKSGARPIVPADVTERFWFPRRTPASGNKVVYRPAVLAQASIHFVRATSEVDYWQDISLLSDCSSGVADPLWGASQTIPPDVLELANQPEQGHAFAELPTGLSAARNYGTWEKELADHLYRNHQIRVFYSKTLKRNSLAGQAEDEARVELAQAAREARDAEVEKLRDKYATKLKSLESRIMTAQQKVEREQEKAKQKSMQSILNVGTSILGALLGNKIASKTNLTKVATAAKGIGSAVQGRGDVARAEESLTELLADREAMEKECQEEVDAITDRFSVASLALETIDIPIRKSDTRVKLLCLLWVPWQVDSQGIATPLVDLPRS
jgi:hypothetical protein